jgi:UDP-N-acetylmuramoyl-tripeptide--D-alanyl-D-alanine ligase
MLELGPLAAAEHDALVRAADAADTAQLLFVGAETGAALDRLAGSIHTPYRAFLTSAEAAAELPDLVETGDVLLVKGSRGMRMERLIEALENRA